MKKPKIEDYLLCGELVTALEAWGDEMNDTRAENLQMNKNLAKDNLALQKKVPYYQLCPKCNGDGDLGRYNSPALSGTSFPICDICNGDKTIYHPSEDYEALQKQLEELEGFAEHNPNCKKVKQLSDKITLTYPSRKCTCGLDELLKDKSK